MTEILQTDDYVAHVLLVDDREEDLELTRIALFMRPRVKCHLHTAKDGREAYKLLTESGLKFDLILLDINMPDVNGFELLQQIQDSDMLQRISIVMCSGSDYESDRRKAMNLGAVGYMIKPPRFSQLKDILDRLPSLRFAQEGAATVLARR